MNSFTGKLNVHTKKIASVLAASMIVLAGCGTSIRYGSGSARDLLTNSERREANIAVVDVMDARLLGKPSPLPLIYDQDKENDFSDLRSAVRDHAVNAGLVEGDAWFPKAPKSEEEVIKLLDSAKERGVKKVLFIKLEGSYATGKISPVTGVVTLLSLPPFFVGLLPLVIVQSLPLNSEYTSVEVSAYMVDPSTRRLLAKFQKSHIIDDSTVTGWGYNPPKELANTAFETVEKIFSDVKIALSSGSVTDQKDVDIAALLFSPPVFNFTN